MVANPPEGFPRVTPYLLYEDVDAAVDWLARAFGFRERNRMNDAEGKANHAEMEVVDSVVMMGRPGPDYQSPKRHGHAHSFVYVYVDDVDRHFERAREAGAKVLSEPQDQFYGDRMYMVEDPEGHQWSFAQHIKDVTHEEMEEAAKPGQG